MMIRHMFDYRSPRHAKPLRLEPSAQLIPVETPKVSVFRQFIYLETTPSIPEGHIRNTLGLKQAN